MIYKNPYTVYTYNMSRSKNVDGIRATTRARDGIQLVHFEEYPGHWIVTPERDRKKTIEYAKRNRERLINRMVHNMAFYCRNFFDTDSRWMCCMQKR
jgi:hypothetical protein